MLAEGLAWGVRTFTVLLGALAALAIFMLATDLPSRLNSAPRTITVSGYASQKVAPNKVDVSASVSTAAKTSAEALDQNNARVAAIVAGLKAEGLADKDIATTAFTITPQHPRESAGGAENVLVTSGYVVESTIIVTLNANADTGKIVDRFARLGATAINGLTFYSEDRESIEDRAREDAARNARLRAERVVKALGARLGRIVKIEPEQGGGGWGLYGFNGATSRYSPEEPVRVAPQAQRVVAALSVTFEIE